MAKLGVVIFGASVYDNHRELNNPRFANSAKEFKKLLADSEIFADCKTEKILDLYNEPDSPSDTLIKIADFVDDKKLDNIIIYYCGHGDIPREKNEYRVFLRKSKRDLRHATLLNMIGLIRDVQRIADRRKIYFVLDSCFSGSAIDQTREFMDAGGADR
jgi:hypothetical protein